MDQRVAKGVTYPALRVEGREEPFSLPRSGSVILGRGELAGLRFDDDVHISRNQAEIRCDGPVCTLVPLSERVATSLNGRELKGPARLRHGDTVAFGDQRIEFLAEAAARAPGGETPAMAATEVVGDYQAYAGRSGPTPARFPNEIRLRGSLEFGRLPGPDSVVLDHPMVSRRHAALARHDGTWHIRDLGSTNGTFVNGERVHRETALADGDLIDIGPFTLRFARGALFRESRVGNIRLIGLNLTRTVRKRTGGALTILSDCSVVIEPNEFACLLGPSGSGKTTLMNALSAREPASRGQVYVNKVSLYDNFDVLKEDMALVPQHDMLHELLTLEAALTYTARLRLPPDQSAADIRREVERVAEGVNMTHRLTTRIGSLSGGQKKRASLASETLSRPSLLFLDEVTSGLDEATDYEIMKLLRQMSENGMTTVCVTHTLANVEEFCHKLVVMANPGVLTFSGTPGEACDFFNVKRLADVYRRLEERPGEEWDQRFRASELHRRYVERPMAELQDELEKSSHAGGVRRSSNPAGEGRGAGQTLRQFAILTRRNARLLLADTKTLIMAFAQAAILGTILGYVFAEARSPGSLDNSYLFMLAITAFWIGCNGASKEIVKERPIYLRERDVNLSVFAYYLSKVAINSAFVVPQLLVVFAMVSHIGAPIPGKVAAQLIYMLLAGVVGTALGLLISAVSKTRDQATTLVPLALVPQIVLAGVIVPQLSALAEFLGRTLISAYWLNEGMMAVCSQCPRPRGIGNLGVLPFLILVFHTVAFIAIGYLFMLYRDARGGRGTMLRHSKRKS